MSDIENPNYFDNSNIIPPLFHNQGQNDSNTNLEENLNKIQNSQATDVEKSEKKSSTNLAEVEEKKEGGNKKVEIKKDNQKNSKIENKIGPGSNILNQNIIPEQNQNSSNISLNQIKIPNNIPNLANNGNLGVGMNILNENGNINRELLGNGNLIINNNALTNSQNFELNSQNENMDIDDEYVHTYQSSTNNMFDNNAGGLINNLDFMDFDGESSNTNSEDRISGFNSNNYSTN